MNPAEAPPNLIAKNALEWFSKAHIRATILYSFERNGNPVLKVATNAGPSGMAQHLAAARIQDGALDRAAIALHEARLQLPENASEEEKAAFDICTVCGQKTNWSALDDVARDFHRNVAKLVVGHALAAPPASATSGLVSV